MLENSAAIVINTIKYGDSSLIVSCYTQCCGLKTYMLKSVLKAKKAKLKPAYFQPLTQLYLTANHNNKGKLNSIRDVEIHHHYNSIYRDIKKQTIALFLAEMLKLSIREEEQNKELYTYIETSLLWLDTHSNIVNFHLLFLLNLTKYLGFYPETEHDGKKHFDMLEGKFTNTLTGNCISGQKVIQFRKLLGINFDVLDKVEYKVSNRQDILNTLIHYFELHLSGFRKPKSIEILKSIFS